MTLTPEQFNKLATKKEINEVREEIKEIKSDIKHIMQAVDSLVVKVNSNDSDMAANQAAHDRFEARITTLETANK